MSVSEIRVNQIRVNQGLGVLFLSLIIALLRLLHFPFRHLCGHIYQKPFIQFVTPFLNFAVWIGSDRIGSDRIG